MSTSQVTDENNKIVYLEIVYVGFPGSSNGKESACNAGDQSSIPQQVHGENYCDLQWDILRRASRVAQWLRIHLLVQETQV